ncbi:tetratricopeptide repeat protein 13-like [Saccostrea cucullata]|uniref:tetratricopeptide repeat protein 13-like n=1 Tax=Saccostrea cuccullata TaxID=36930 RepID=UPI002ED2717B
MEGRLLLVFTCLVSCLFANNVYDVEKFQVENEDGTTQIFEVKRLEPVNGESCAICSQNTVNSSPRLTPIRSNVFIAVGEVATDCEENSAKLPTGLCSNAKDRGHCSRDTLSCEHSPEDLAEDLAATEMVPMQTKNYDIDSKLALGFVSINIGNLDDAMQIFNSILSYHPDTVGAHYGRGIVYQRMGIQEIANAAKSIREFTEAIMKDNSYHEIYERRAESYIAIQHFADALKDLNMAAKSSPSKRLYFIRGIVHLLLENFAEAEEDFRKNLDPENSLHVGSNFHLGLALYYQGKVRNAIEVFKDVLKLKPDHVEASTSLGQAFRELGNLKPAWKRFNQSIHMNPNHAQTWQLWGSMLYTIGEHRAAKLNFDKCLKINPSNINCQYMQSLTYIAMGKYYQGLKSSMKVMINNTPAIKATPEFIKAHYLREYARFLHSKLDTPLVDINIDNFHPEFKDRWTKQFPFQFKNTYKEQPGLQPEINDVSYVSIMEYGRELQGLICKAHRVGLSMQVAADGYLPSRRHNFAMGLASMHIAQLLDKRWREIRLNKQIDRSLDWREVFSIAVQYRRLIDPEQPIFWLDKMPDHATEDGYHTEINFIKGDVQNIKVMQYYDLVFKLAKTMLEHYAGDGAIFYHDLRQDVERAKTCEDLLMIARKRNINENGFMVSTQVPSSRNDERLDGSMVVLSRDMSNKMTFAISIVNNKARTQLYHAEIDAVFNQIQEEIKRIGIGKALNTDSVMDKILTMMYYIYNLMPLTRGNSAVIYSVAMGIIMSVNKFVFGKIPSGKLLEMEAILSGAPDAFILVTKNWMNVKGAEVPITIHPKIWDVLPNVRNIVEVLNVNTDLCVMPASP